MNEPPLEIDVTGRDRRLYDRVRAKLTGVDAPGKIADLLLLLPDLVVLLARLLRDGRVPLGAKLTAAAGIAYVISPVDLMPEVLFGPLGILDDRGFPRREMGIMESPREDGQPKAVPGSRCNECGNFTVIRRDGCDFCTACGSVGTCG